MDSGGNIRQWWPIVTVVESTLVDSGGQWWTVVDSGGNSRQWWPIVTVVESTLVDSGDKSRQWWPCDSGREYCSGQWWTVEAIVDSG